MPLDPYEDIVGPQSSGGEQDPYADIVASPKSAQDPYADIVDTPKNQKPKPKPAQQPQPKRDIKALFGRDYPKIPEEQYETPISKQPGSQVRDILQAPVAALQTVIHGTAEKGGEALKTIGGLAARGAAKAGKKLGYIPDWMPEEAAVRGLRETEDGTFTPGSLIATGQDVIDANRDAVKAENEGVKSAYGINQESELGEASNVGGEVVGGIAKFALAPQAATAEMVGGGFTSGFNKAEESGASFPQSLARGGSSMALNALLTRIGGPAAYSSIQRAVAAKVARGAALGTGLTFAEQALDKAFIDHDIPLTPETDQLKRNIVQMIAFEVGGDLAHGKQGSILGAREGAAPPTALDSIRNTLAPGTAGPEARQTAGIYRENLAKQALGIETAKRELEPARKSLDPISREFEMGNRDNFVEFTRAFESGGKTTPELQKPAADIRKQLDDVKQEVQDLGTGKLDSFIENYLPHIWKNPQQAETTYVGRRPLEGPKSFLKERTIPTIEEGLALGLEPLVSNPADMALLKITEMKRYVTGQKIFDELADKGLIKYVPRGGERPEGYKPLNDKIAKVFQRNEPDAGGGMIARGEYMAPEPVARIFNNHLSPGLRGNAAYDAVAYAGNMLNQAQLGLSAFHLGMTSIDSAVSKASLAIQQAVSGQPLEAVKSVSKLPLAPVLNARQGNNAIKLLTSKPTSEQAIKAADALGIPHEAIPAVVEAFTSAGGRISMDSHYSNQAYKSFKDALPKAWGEVFTGKTASAIPKAIPAAIELATKPVMEYAVPRMKLGIFLDLAKYEMSKLPENATPEQRREVYGRAWDSVDNRMGQMVYDNLFWDRTLKDLAHISTRSLGWNLGTIRELGGGASDLVSIAAGQKSLADSPRAAYTVALPVVVGIMGAITQYLSTGKGPDEVKDYFYPKTGEQNPDGTEARIQFPSYMKDVAAYGRDPVTTILHKANPAISTASDMIRNKDFYGTKIFDETATLPENIVAGTKYTAGQFTPFAVRGYQQANEEGKSTADKVLPFVGITQAPKWASQTDAQQLIGKLAGGQAPVGGRTIEELEKSRQSKLAGNALASGNKDKALEILAQGKASAKSAIGYAESAALPQAQRDAARAKSLRSLRDVYAVYREADPDLKIAMIEDMAGRAERVLEEPQNHSDAEIITAKAVIETIKKERKGLMQYASKMKASKQ